MNQLSVVVCASLFVLGCGAGSSGAPIGGLGGKAELKGEWITLERSGEKVGGYGIRWEVECPAHPCVVEVKVFADSSLPSMAGEHPVMLNMDVGEDTFMGRAIRPDGLPRCGSSRQGFLQS